MTSVQLLPLVAGGLFVLFTLYITFSDGKGSRNSWFFPAALSALFLAYSLIAVFNEGPLGFWPVHTHNLWGNQVWFDLLLAVGIGWCLIAPQARKLGMNLFPWLILITCTGCIGFLAMVARYLYLRDNQVPQGS